MTGNLSGRLLVAMTASAPLLQDNSVRQAPGESRHFNAMKILAFLTRTKSRCISIQLIPDSINCP